MQTRQVRVGSGGSNSFPVHIQFDGGSIQSMMGPGNWIYIVGIAVLLVVIIVLVVLTIREYYLLKRNKK